MSALRTISHQTTVDCNAAGRDTVQRQLLTPSTRPVKTFVSVRSFHERSACPGGRRGKSDDPPELRGRKSRIDPPRDVTLDRFAPPVRPNTRAKRGRTTAASSLALMTIGCEQVLPKRFTCVYIYIIICSLPP